MFTTSDLMSRLLTARVPAYLVMMVHETLTVPLAPVLELFFIRY